MLDELSASLGSAGRAPAAWRERLTANEREADRPDRAARTARQRLADADQAVALARGEAVGPAVEHRQAARAALERVLDEARRPRARNLRQAVAAAGAVRASTGPVVPALSRCAAALTPRAAPAPRPPRTASTDTVHRRTT